MTTVKNIYDYINSVAPFDTMEQWDNSGFLVGDFRGEVKKAVVTLDVTKSVAEYAESIGADLIISHHPIIFGGVKSIKKDSALYTAVNSDIAAAAAPFPPSSRPWASGRSGSPAPSGCRP